MYRCSSNIRKPVVAGMFYPSDKNKLLKELEKVTFISEEKIDALSIIVPHAGYVYSGNVAGEVFSRINIPDTVIIFGPNHRLYGKEKLALYSEGSWLSPFGKIQIDNELGKLILNDISEIKKDFDAHLYEHSIEVMIPFIQYFSKTSKILPITIKYSPYNLKNIDEIQNISKKLANIIKNYNKKVLILASTDMTHYENAEFAKLQDQKAIDKILNLDAKGLFETVKENNISMCGTVGVSLTISISKELEAKNCQLVKYTNSGDISLDYSQVVAYAGFIIN